MTKVTLPSIEEFKKRLKRSIREQQGECEASKHPCSYNIGGYQGYCPVCDKYTLMKSRGVRREVLDLVVDI